MIDTIRTRQLWEAIHNFARVSKVGLDQVPFMDLWLISSKIILGCDSCWRKVEWFRSKWPIAYGEGLYLWSICLHDYVNKEMGRPLFFPELTLEPLTAKGIIQ